MRTEVGMTLVGPWLAEACSLEFSRHDDQILYVVPFSLGDSSEFQLPAKISTQKAIHSVANQQLTLDQT